jgi:hypothetical protein
MKAKKTEEKAMLGYFVNDGIFYFSWISQMPQFPRLLCAAFPISKSHHKIHKCRLPVLDQVKEAPLGQQFHLKISGRRQILSYVGD